MRFYKGIFTIKHAVLYIFLIHSFG